MNIEKLYKSGHFTLYCIDVTGKKETASTLYFKGLPSWRSHVCEICAVEDGIVLYAGRDYNANHRANRLGTYINIVNENGVTVTYAHLATLAVKVGDRVKVGDVIGYIDVSLPLTVQCRRNDRFIDACKYFEIERKRIEFDVKDDSARGIVCERCDLSDAMREHIDSYFNADGLWERLAQGICDDI